MGDCNQENNNLTKGNALIVLLVIYPIINVSQEVGTLKDVSLERVHETYRHCGEKLNA